MRNKGATTPDNDTSVRAMAATHPELATPARAITRTHPTSVTPARAEAHREMLRARRDLDRQAADRAVNAFLWLLLLFAWVTVTVMLVEWAAGVIL